MHHVKHDCLKYHFSVVREPVLTPQEFKTGKPSPNEQVAYGNSFRFRFII
jgi:hypothetical protein